MSALRVLPWALHVAFEYLAGIFLVVSAFVFDYTDSTAFPVLLVAGMIALATAILSPGALGVYGLLPVQMQALIDYLLAFALMGAPFAFGFRDEADALLVSVMTGLGLLVTSLLSRYPRPAPAPAPVATTSEITTPEITTPEITTPEITTREHAPTTEHAHQPEPGREPDPELPAWVQSDDDGRPRHEADDDNDDHEADDEASADHRR